ncbi:unnamed protein product, partial [Pylaiella littoralis]
PGDDQEDEVVTTRVVAPTQAQRALAVDVIQRAENQKQVGLIQDSDISRELRLKLDGVLDVMRDADGSYTWFTMRTHLDVAIRMATDLNLLDARKVLSDTVARGNRMVVACNDPVLVLGVFSKMLPSVHAVSQEVYEADCADLRKVTALSRNFFTNPSGAGGGSGSGGGSSSGKARGSGRKHAATQPSIAGTLHGNAF